MLLHIGRYQCYCKTLKETLKIIATRDTSDENTNNAFNRIRAFPASWSYKVSVNEGEARTKDFCTPRVLRIWNSTAVRRYSGTEGGLREVTLFPIWEYLAETWGGSGMKLLSLYSSSRLILINRLEQKLEGFNWERVWSWICHLFLFAHLRVFQQAAPVPGRSVLVDHGLFFYAMEDL
jgi:hypothetical protein